MRRVFGGDFLWFGQGGPLAGERGFRVAGLFTLCSLARCLGGSEKYGGVIWSRFFVIWMGRLGGGGGSGVGFFFF